MVRLGVVSWGLIFLCLGLSSCFIVEANRVARFLRDIIVAEEAAGYHITAGGYGGGYGSGGADRSNLPFLYLRH